MSTTKIISNKINQYAIDIKSDKVTTRQSALEGIVTLLDNQPDDVIGVLESGNEDCMSWTNLFDKLHSAVQEQCGRLDSARSATSLNTLSNKNDAYKGALIKCINLANHHKLNVPLRVICEAAFECFGNATMRKYFDGCYLKIINTQILNTKFPLDNMELSHWSQLLSSIFELYVDQNTAISRLELLQCIPSLLRHAFRYTYLLGDLSKYLPTLVMMIKDESHQYKTQKQILFTIYEVMRCMASSQRKVMVEFTEQVLDRIYKMYQFSLDDDVKEVIFKIVHLSIVIHSPQNDQATVKYSRSNDLFADNVAYDVNQWHKQLQNMFGVIEREISSARKQPKRFSPKLTVCDELVQMAAKLCSVIFWNENVWATTTTTTDNDEQIPKRRRQTMKLERILGLVEYEPEKFCWRWFAILSELLVSFPHLLGADDYQPLLKMLADYQSAIHDTSDMKSFIKIVRTMLNAEAKLVAAPSSPIRSSFCNESWHKIIEFAHKQAATDKSQNENLELMGILVSNGIIVSYDFIKTVITDIIKMTSIRKSNNSIELLIKIFRSINVDLINGIHDIKMSVITWLSMRIAATELKRVIASVSGLDKKLIAELYVLCILSRQGQSNTFVKKFEYQADKAMTIQDEYRSEICKIEKNLQYLALTKLIVCDLKKITDQNKSKHTNLPDRSEVKAIINETFNAKMEESLHSDDISDAGDNQMENFVFVSKSLQMYVNVLNCLIEYEAMDAETLNTSNLKKRILIRIAQLNDIVEKFDNRMNFQQSPEDVNEISGRLLKVWNDDNHLAVASIIYTQKNDSIISWLLRQLSPSQRPASRVFILLKHENEMEFAYRVQMKCLTLVAHFSVWDNIDRDNEMFEGIQEYDFELTRNEDIFMVFELVKTIFNQKLTTEVVIEWAFERLQEIFSGFHRNQHLIDIVMEILPAAIRCIKHYEKMHDDLFKLLVGVCIQSRKRKYGQSITLKAIKCLKYFAREFFSDEHCVGTLNILKKFLVSEYLSIQLVTVECLTNIFNKQWLCPDLDSVDCLSIQNFHLELFDKLNLDQMPRCDGDDGIIMDRKANVFATYLQLFSSIIGSCFVLRRKMWFQLIDFCRNQIQRNEEKTQKLITKLCTEMFNANPSDLLERDIPYLISRWVQESYSLSSFPWQLTSSKSKDDFVPEHIECITLNIILYQSNLLPQLVQTMNNESLSDLLTKSILIKCLAFSINAKHSESRERKEHGIKVIHTLMSEVPDLEQYLRTDSLHIMYEMLNTMCDRLKFTELFDMNVEHANDENAMDYQCFIKSMEYIQKKCDRQQSSLLNYFCEYEPVNVINILYSLKLNIQQCLCEELKLHQLFRICALIDIITEFLAKNAQSSVHKNVIEFFVRDFIYFFGNLISGSVNAEKMKLAACNYFYRFNRKILPKCAEQFQPHLNYIVSVLMPMTKVKPSKIINKAMDLLNFLIVEQRDALHMYIGLLDNFPSSPEFDRLRQIQNDSKYDGKTFTLLDEIECFLAIDKRKTEGLLSLKEHLSSKKNELQKIYEHIYDSRGFSEDCDKSVIHRLIFTLLQTVQSVDKEKSILAAKCLGELGPSDLGTMCLRFDSQPQNYKDCPNFADAVGHLCEFMLEKLNGLFAHSDANVLKATSTACQQLLRCRKVTEFLNRYPSLSIFKTTPTMELPFDQPKGQLNLSKWFNNSSFHSTHSIWIKNIAIELFTFCDADYLAELAAMQTQFAEAMVPLLVKVILKTGVKAYLEDINKSIDIFFANHSTKEDSNQNGQANTTDANSPVFMNKISIKLMLNIAECVRIHNQSLETRNDLTMNYLHIAKAASFCHAHFTAILYGELLALDEGNQTDVTVINSIMMNAYKAINETDAVSAFLDPIKDPIQYLISKQDWSRTLNILDVSPMSGGFSSFNQYLGQAGLYGLANKLSQATDSTNYECAWRLGDWSILDAGASAQGADNNRQTNDFEKYHYFALKSLQQKDEIAVRFNIENGLNEIIKGLKSTSYECTKNIYKDLMKLHMLQQIDEFCDVQFPIPKNVKQNSPEFIIQKWQHQDAVPSNEFSCREPILAQRIILFQLAGVRAKRKIEDVCNLTNGIQQMILQLAGECRVEGCYSKSQRYLASLRELNPSRDITSKMLYENAKLSWDIGDHVLTKHLIDAVRNQRSVHPQVSIAALGMYGEYMAETRAENIRTIIEEYFKKSNKMSKALKMKLESAAESSQKILRDSNLSLEMMRKFDSDNIIRNLRAMAKYADREYQQIAAYKKSSDFEKKQQNVEKNLKILGDLRNAGSELTDHEKKSQSLITKSVNIDKADIKSTNEEYNWYLEMTVHTYLNCLAAEKGNETDCFIMFRVFALLLANPTNASILQLIEAASVRIPTFKFIEVIPQITAHLNTNNDDLGNLIHDIVLKCAKEHPHHVIMKLFALANAHVDGEHSGATPSPARTDASRLILNKLRNDMGTRSIVEQMEEMCTVLIDLANKKMKGQKSFPSQEPLLKLRNLNKVHCPTLKLNVSPSGNYGNIVGISKYCNELMQPGGINCPKRIACIGTDGEKYLQLLKGEDDPRQDAVMQQVFCIVNNMLNQSKVTKKDRLIIRTYAVIPLSQRSGILEWCTNTTTMGQYLIGSNGNGGAHQRYRPQDRSPSECRTLYCQVDRTHSHEQRYLNFLNICKHIQPVFHHFFFEYFYNPGVWFERRLAYAHSLATTSMMCYLLGIGDRHVNNILIDETTAEVIHIDFGIAFEKAKCLPTPEPIPFRLTRDLISALGPSKVEGVFKKTCEKTMQVLRQHKSTILTIVEVLMHDPLNAWTLTSSEAAKRQQTDIHLDEQDVNAMAERALIRLEEKLDGKHVSRSDSLSVERHVEILIQEATDDKKLCTLFVGWQPYL